MSEARYEILIHRLIDGEITADEQTELDILLAASPPARAFHERMLLLSREGRQALVVTAPAGLRDAVLANIDHARYRTDRGRTTARRIDVIKSIFISRMAYGLAAGLVLGIAIGSYTTHRSENGVAAITPHDVSGALGAPPSNGRVSRVSQVPFRADGISGRLTADQFGSHGSIRIEINSTSSTEIVMEFNPADAIIQTLEQQNAGLMAAEIDSGRLVLTHVGDNSYTAMFRLGEAPLTVTCLVRAGNEVLKEDITFTGSGR